MKSNSPFNHLDNDSPLSSPISKRFARSDITEKSRKRHKSDILDTESMNFSDEDAFIDEIDGKDTKASYKLSDLPPKNSSVLKSITNISPVRPISPPKKAKNSPSDLDDIDFEDWNDNLMSSPCIDDDPNISVYNTPSSGNELKSAANSSGHRDLYESISIYQSKVTELHNNHIALLSALLEKPSSINSEDSALALKFQREISAYENGVSSLVRLANVGDSLPSPVFPNEPPKSSISSYTHAEPNNTESSTKSLEVTLETSTTSGFTSRPLNLDPKESADFSAQYNLGASTNSPATAAFDDDFDYDDVFEDSPESIFDGDIQNALPFVRPQRHLSPGIEIVSSDIEALDFCTDVDEAQGFEDITTSPQGVKMAQVTKSNPVSNKEFPWSEDLERILHDTFNLDEFRCNQLEAVNSTLLGKDVFVLMPTGGGKSLCYQLPALINSGKTKGSTVVVSPLVSLMQDQTFHLKKKGINAAMLSARAELHERNEVFKNFLSGELTLLYVSPEMLNLSFQLRRTLSDLSNRNMLARIVIDEAHCVSSWGHDFRPDYKLLENLKNEYPSTPIMALTATANERVRLDIFKCLRENNTTFLKQSFNRANLYYEVRDKSKDVNSIITSLMSTEFKNQSGIIYCHSRNSCESTAQSLRDAGLRVTFYHALLSYEEREAVQISWQSGEVQAICATIAFGMGIDKPDVRFVFHLTLPRSMEGYYQETGRAGRDGLPSKCVLFYSFRDALNLQSMINKDDLKPDAKARHKEMLKRVIQYCQNSTDCRRKQVLQYFSETFDVRKCRGGCDNCKFGQNTVKEIRDVSERAKEIIDLVSSIQNDYVTLNHCIDVYRGSRMRALMDKHHDRAKNYGQGKNLDRTEVERMFHHLITEGILDEYSIFRGGFSCSYIKRGTESQKVISGSMTVAMVFNPTFAKNPTPSRQQNTTKGATPAKTPSRATPVRATPTRSTPARTSSSRAPPSREPPQNSARNTVTPRAAANSPFAPRSVNSSWYFEENCYGKLELKRLQLKKDFSLAQVSDVCSNEALREMAKLLPTDIESFSKVTGITSLQVENFYMYFRPELIKLEAQKPAAGLQGGQSDGFSDDDSLEAAFMDDDGDDMDFEAEPTGAPVVGAESPYFLPTATINSYSDRGGGASRQSSSRSSSTFTSRLPAGNSNGYRRTSRGRGGRNRGGSSSRGRSSSGAKSGRGAKGMTQSRLSAGSSIVKMMPM